MVQRQSKTQRDGHQRSDQGEQQQPQEELRGRRNDYGCSNESARMLSLVGTRADIENDGSEWEEV